MPRLVSATRIQLVCPAGNPDLRRETYRIIQHLVAEEVVQSWGGLTYSIADPPAFLGQFWGGDHWETDENVLISLDAPGRSARSLLPYLTELRDRLNEIYRSVDQPQKALWITTHSLRIVLD